MAFTKNFFYSGRWIQLLINNGSGVFTDATSSRLVPVQSDNSLTAYRFARFVDLNGDGDHDLVGQLFANTDGHRFFKADAAGIFSSVTFLAGALSDVFAFVDANGNGHRDVLDIGYAGANQDRISLLPNIGAVQPPGPPLDVTATRGLAGHIRVRWPYVWGATQYEVWRSPSPGSVGTLIATTAASGLDDGLPSGGADYYRVRAINGAGSSGYSVAARGSAIVPDDPVVAGLTVIRAVDVTRLRTRIDFARRRYGLAPYGYVDPVLAPGMIPKAQHIADLRAAIAQAYAAAQLTPPAYTDAALPSGTVIKAAHVLELRAATAALP
jgi:hypothetical protein